MPLEVEMQQRSDYLVFIITGIFSIQEAIERFPMVVAGCNQTNLDKAIIDYRAVEGPKISTEEIIYAMGAAEIYQQHLSAGGIPLRIAFVGKKDNLRPWGPGEKMATNLGMQVLVTADYDEAVNWLFEE